MKKIQYVNEMPYEKSGKKGAPYHIIGAKGNCNHGNLCESIIKYHRGLEYLTNPNTDGMEGYDLPEEMAEVKSSAAGLGRNIGEVEWTQSKKIKYYFQHAPKGKKWIWVEFNEKTQEVVEYHMNKKEFGYFMTISLRGKQHKQSNGKGVNVRFKYTTKKMINWMESQVA